jgi:hypothetical protein
VTLDKIIELAYLPAIELISIKDTREAQVMILAIGLQESRFLYRKQMGNGPARSFWQFERGGGVKGVLTHSASKAKALHLCDVLGYAPDAMTVWTEMEHDDVLGAGFARLLLLTDPRPLPSIDDEQAAWDYYFRNWRPGKPHRDTWNALHGQAVVATV